ncbi:uncharacterized protein LOC130717003 [Lotus japonicus]|uniref:uncharacterized protein LOC130717003 n=1 Tax=Lotus japonicus TaxID=34305 RepID=UPI00258707BF|nr:uncharacterized protein LOC130717003 [Lotus japonicus]
MVVAGELYGRSVLACWARSAQILAFLSQFGNPFVDGFRSGFVPTASPFPVRLLLVLVCSRPSSSRRRCLTVSSVTHLVPDIYEVVGLRPCGFSDLFRCFWRAAMGFPRGFWPAGYGCAQSPSASVTEVVFEGIDGCLRFFLLEDVLDFCYIGNRKKTPNTKNVLPPFHLRRAGKRFLRSLPPHDGTASASPIRNRLVPSTSDEVRTLWIGDLQCSMDQNCLYQCFVLTGECRQKIKGVAALCKNLKKGKPCKIGLCHSCLLNRYGEDAQQVNRLDGWSCPKCRGKCNCSLCMQNKGKEPTGRLTREARTAGFRSVMEYLDAKEAAELNTNANDVAAVLPPEEIVMELLEAREAAELNTNANDVAAVLPPEKIDGLEAALGANDFPPIPHQNEETKCERDDKNVWDDFDFSEAVSQDEIFADLERNQDTDYHMKDVKDEISEEVLLPPGTELTEVLGIEFPHEDVGNVVQFLDFCRVFGKGLNMKEGEAKTILRELVRKQNLRSGENTLAVEFQTRLLTLLRTAAGHKSPSLATADGNFSWLKALGDLALQSPLLLKDFPVEMLNKGLSGYCNLSLSDKLRLLTFICDEVLNSEKVRSYIEKENSKIEKQRKEAKAEFAAAKEKVKSLKQKLQEETAKRIHSSGDPGSSTEQDAAVLKLLTTEVAQAHSEMLEAKENIPKRKISNATRIEPHFVDGRKVFWKLKCFEGEDTLLLQDIKVQEGDGTATDERWFFYGPEKKNDIDKYIASRIKRNKGR